MSKGIPQAGQGEELAVAQEEAEGSARCFRCPSCLAVLEFACASGEGFCPLCERLIDGKRSWRNRALCSHFRTIPEGQVGLRWCVDCTDILEEHPSLPLVVPADGHEAAVAVKRASPQAEDRKS